MVLFDIILYWGFKSIQYYWLPVVVLVKLTNSNSICDKLELLRVIISGVSYDSRLVDVLGFSLFTFDDEIKL